MSRNAGPAFESGIVAVTRPAVASEAYAERKGRFVALDSSEYVAQCDSASASVFGFVLDINRTTDSVAGTSKLTVDVGEGPWWISAESAVTANMIGKICDLIAVTGGNDANIDLSTTDVLTVIDVDITNQMLLVKITEGKRQATGI
jgi:hypothetical protein